MLWSLNLNLEKGIRWFTVGKKEGLAMYSLYGWLTTWINTWLDGRAERVVVYGL